MIVEDPEAVTADWRDRRVMISDGTRPGRVLAVASIVAVVIATVGLLAWQWFPGPTAPLLSLEGEIVDVPRSVVLVGLLVVAVLSALLTWHAAGARTIRPVLALVAVAVVGTACALLVLAWSMALRDAVDEIPSFAGAAWAVAHRLASVAAVAIACAVVVPLVGWFRGRRSRLAATVLAAAAPAIVAWVYAAEAGSQVVEAGGHATTNSSGVLAVPAQLVDAGPWFTASAVVLTAAMGIGVVAIVAVFGVREFADKKGAFASAALRVGLPIRRPLALALGAMLAALFVIGRLDVIPDFRGSLPALSKSGVEPWLLAAAFAAWAVFVIARSEAQPVSERGLTRPLLAAGGLLISGHLVSACVSALLVLTQPVLDSRGWRNWLVADLGGWAVWLQVWSSILVPLGAAAWGLWLRRQGERSDRTVFLLSLAVISLLPGLQIVLQHRGIDSFFTDITVATADQVMLVAVAMATLAVLFGRSLLKPARVVRLQLVVLLATFVAAMIATAIQNRYFQLGLVIPLAFGLVRGSAETRGRPARGAHSLAVTGFLLVLLTAGLISGYVGESTSGGTELLVFLVLSGPLVLVELLATDPDRIRREPDSNRTGAPRASSVVLPLLSIGLAVIAVIAVAKSDPADPHRPLRVDVAVRKGWRAEQEVADGAESVWLTHGSAVIVARSVSGNVAFCSEGAAGLLPDVGDPGVDAGFVAGLPARTYQRPQGTITCGELSSDDGSSYILVVHDGSFSAEEEAQLGAITFAVAAG